MKHLTELLNSLADREFKITTTKNGSQQLHQTQRNNLKAELLNAIMLDIQESYEYVYQSKDGILLEIANETIANALDSASEGSGAITICLDLSIKSLESNASLDNEIYLREVEQKAEKKKADEEKKKAKIDKDKANRKKKED